MKVAVVTLKLAPPADPSVVASRELSFAPAPLDLPNPLTVAADAATVEGLKFALGIGVTGTLTDVSARGARSPAVSFHVDATPPEVVPPPAPPSVAGVIAAEVPDPPDNADSATVDTTSPINAGGVIQ